MVLNKRLTRLLDRRKISPIILIEEYQYLDQRELCDKYRLQRTDLTQIFNSFNLDTKQIAKQRCRKKIEKPKLFYPYNDLDILMKHIDQFGFKDAADKFSKIKLDLFKKVYPNYKTSHASTIRSNLNMRSARENINEIKSLMKNNTVISKIADDLGLSRASVKELVFEIDQNYKEIDIEKSIQTETNRKESIQRVKERTRKRLLERLDSKSLEYYENLVFVELKSIRSLREILRVSSKDIEEYIENKLGFDLRKIRNENQYFISAILYCKDKILTDNFYYDECLKYDIQIPEILKEYNLLYKAIYLTKDQNFVQNFVTKYKIENCKDLNKYINFKPYQSLCEDIRKMKGFEFYTKTELELLKYKYKIFENFQSVIEIEKHLKHCISISNSLDELASNLKMELNETSAILRHFKIKVKFKYSGPESELMKILNNFDETYICSDRSYLTNNKEIDFFYETKRIGIELNPIHTHNSTIGFKKRFKALEESYHRNKSIDAKNNEIDLIHLYSCDLDSKNKKENYISYLKTKIVGYDTTLTTKEIVVILCKSKEEKSECKDFLKKYYRDKIKVSNVFYKIVHRGNIVGVFAFSFYKNRASKAYLNNYCYLPSLKVKYALSKVIKSFKKDYPKANTLITEANMDYGRNLTYESIGFKFLKYSKLSFIWVSNSDDSEYFESSKNLLKTHRVKENLFNSDSEKENFIINDLTHINDDQKGYVKLFKSGYRIYELALDR